MHGVSVWSGVRVGCKSPASTNQIAKQLAATGGPVPNGSGDCGRVAATGRLGVYCPLAENRWGQAANWLAPLLAKNLVRTRRNIAAEWEKNKSREYLYGGAGNGSEVAAWRQVARAELSALGHKSYAQGFLDLVKAYEWISHWVLLPEAENHGFPTRLLKLAVAAYRLLRVIRID